MLDFEVRRMIMEDRIATLRRSARPRKRTEPVRVESPDIELRMCKPADDPEIDRLAALSEVPVPSGRLVVALLDGKLVAALPLNGDPVAPRSVREDRTARAPARGARRAAARARSAPDARPASAAEACIELALARVTEPGGGRDDRDRRAPPGHRQ